MKLKKKKQVLTEEKGEKKYVIKKERGIDIGSLFNLKRYEIGKDYIKTETGKYAKLILPAEYPKIVNAGFMGEFFSSHYRTDVSLYLDRMSDDFALGILQKELTTIMTELATTPPTSYRYSKLTLERDSAEQMRDLLSARQTHLYHATMVVGVRGDNYSEAKKLHGEMISRFKALNFKVSQGFYRVWDMFLTFSPIHRIKIPYHKGRVIHTAVATAMFPFVSATYSIIGDNAILFGINEINDTPVFVDRFKLTSYNMLIFGKTGGGKSYFEKLTMVRSKMVNPQVLIYAIDPLGENGSLFKAMGGKSIKVWNGKEVINPLDPRLGEDVSERTNSIIAMLSTMFNIVDEERALLNIVLTRLFTQHEGEEMIMSDLLREMEKEKGLMRLRNAMRIFEEGSLSFLNRKSTIDISGEKYVNFDFKGMPEQYIPLFMFMLTSFVYSQIRSEQNRDIPKLFFIDEVHYIWKYPSCAELLNWLARHTRHYKASMVLITQSANDGFLNPYTRAIMENTQIHMLFHHDFIDDDATKFYTLLQSEVDYVKKAHGGKGYGFSTGLLWINGLKIPMRIYASPEEDQYLKT